MIQGLSEIGWPTISGIGTIGIGLVWLIIEGRGRNMWAPKSIADEVEKNKNMFRVHETRLSSVEQTCAHQDHMLSEAVTKPLARIASQLDEVARRQGEHGESLAAMRETQKAFGQSLDTIRHDVSRLQER